MTAVKICGVRSVADARVAVDAGADALGLNFWARSPRRCHLEEATRIARTVGDRVRLVGVYVDASIETIEDTRARTGVRWAQLHGDEPEAMLRALLPEAYRAVHAVGPAGEGRALTTAGAEVLLDARLPGKPGGTGRRCDWDLAARVAARRPVWLAGGLTPENVAEAIGRVGPHGVDVASGVEAAPGRQDPERVRAFVRAAKAAS